MISKVTLTCGIYKHPQAVLKLIKCEGINILKILGIYFNLEIPQ